jgi:hypothetical protein
MINTSHYTTMKASFILASCHLLCWYQAYTTAAPLHPIPGTVAPETTNLVSPDTLDNISTRAPPLDQTSSKLPTRIVPETQPDTSENGPVDPIDWSWAAKAGRDGNEFSDK